MHKLIVLLLVLVSNCDKSYFASKKLTKTSNDSAAKREVLENEGGNNQTLKKLFDTTIAELSCVNPADERAVNFVRQVNINNEEKKQAALVLAGLRQKNLVELELVIGEGYPELSLEQAHTIQVNGISANALAFAKEEKTIIAGEKPPGPGIKHLNKERSLAYENQLGDLLRVSFAEKISETYDLKYCGCAPQDISSPVDLEAYYTQPLGLIPEQRLYRGSRTIEHSLIGISYSYSETNCQQTQPPSN